MRRVALIVALSGAVAGVALAWAAGGERAVEGEACVDGDASAFTAESLHDIRSYSDAMAIVVAVDEEIPPPPSGPEGWAGLIGRRVTVRVEDVLWRRPKAPEPRRSFRFSDWGWFGEYETRVPARVCGGTRMELGTRYLAPVARLHGTWYPFTEARLRLLGDLVVGGVDGGEPNHAHNALSGRSVESAVRMVAETRPYRAVVRRPRGSPARRWQNVDADGYRLWREPPGVPWTVASGVTGRSRWELFVRSRRPSDMCVGLRARPLWDESGEVVRQRCRRREIAKDAVTVEGFAPAGLGPFAYGRVGRRVAVVRVRFGAGRWRRLQTAFTPIPPGGGERYWIVPAAPACGRVTVQSLGWIELERGKRRSGRLRGPGCG